jgi:hypothetical protein
MTKFYSVKNRQDLLEAAIASTPFLYRWLGISVPLSRLDRELGASRDWKNLRDSLRPTDKIWPFHFNKNTLAMRKGFLIVRDRKPFEAIVTELS